MISSSTDGARTFYNNAIPAYCHGTLLDLGAGDVPFYQAYRPHAESIICIDWPNTSHSVDHLDIQHDINDGIPLENASVDTIIVSDVLEHIYETKNLFAELGRVIAPGGYIIGNVPFYYPLHEQPYDYYRYTEFSLKLLAESANLSIVSIDATGGIPSISLDLLSKSLVSFGVPGRLCTKAIQGFAVRASRTRPGAKLLS